MPEGESRPAHAGPPRDGIGDGDRPPPMLADATARSRPGLPPAGDSPQDGPFGECPRPRRGTGTGIPRDPQPFADRRGRQSGRASIRMRVRRGRRIGRKEEGRTTA
jgi:hypothetical protein